MQPKGKHVMLPKPPRCGGLPPSGSSRKTFSPPSKVYLPPPVEENALTIQVRPLEHCLIRSEGKFPTELPERW